MSTFTAPSVPPVSSVPPASPVPPTMSFSSKPLQDPKGRGLSKFLGSVIDYSVLVLAALMPIWFLPVTLDAVELSKQTLLIALTSLAVLAWIGKMLVDRECIFRKSWMHLIVLFFLAGYLVTSFFSSDRYLSFVGNIGQMQWAFASIASFVLLYFVIVNRISGVAGVHRILRWFVAGSLAAGIFGLAQMLGVHLLGSAGMVGAKTFNSIGTINTLGVFLTIPMTLALSCLLLCSGGTCACCQNKKSVVGLIWTIVMYEMIAVGCVVAILVDFWAVWILLIVGAVLPVGIYALRTKALPKIPVLSIAGGIVIISALLFFFRSPIDLGLPGEVAPSPMHSWSIARQTLTEHPLFGSGPGTWMYDYAKYRSAGTNVSAFWMTRFERGITSFLTIVAMLGVIGTALWLMLVFGGGIMTVKKLVTEKQSEEWNAYLMIGISWFMTVLTVFLYHFNVSHHFVFWLLLALLGFLFSKPDQQMQKKKPWIFAVLASVLIIASLGVISAGWLCGQRLAADIQYNRAITAYQKGDSIDRSIGLLESAVSLNRLNDLYHRNLAQGYLAKVDQLIQGQPDEDRIKEVGDLINKAVESSKTAIANGPSSVDNYANLAVIYQAVSSFIPGTDEMAIKSYEDSLALEPNNAVFMNEIGKLYVLRSDAYRTKLSASDEAARKEAEQNVAAELDKASSWFNKAITAKPDYAAARFNLGLVYERQNRLPEAIQKFEEVLATNPTDKTIALQLAILYYRNGNQASSQALFEQLVLAEPNFADARWFLSAIYEEKGEYDKAIEQVAKIQETNPDNQTVKDRLNTLNQKKTASASPAPAAIQPLEQGVAAPGM